jgi:hypothetical protein
MTAHKVSVGVSLNIDDVVAIQEKISSELCLSYLLLPLLILLKVCNLKKTLEESLGIQ